MRYVVVYAYYFVRAFVLLINAYLLYFFLLRTAELKELRFLLQRERIEKSLVAAKLQEAVRVCHSCHLQLS